MESEVKCATITEPYDGVHIGSPQLTLCERALEMVLQPKQEENVQT